MSILNVLQKDISNFSLFLMSAAFQQEFGRFSSLNFKPTCIRNERNIHVFTSDFKQLYPIRITLKCFFVFFVLFIYLFIFGCVGSSFLCDGFLQLRRAGVTLHRGARASHYRSLSRCGAQAPDAQAQ